MCTEPGVIGKVPARMVGVVVNHNWIRVPQPVAAVTVFGRRDRKIEAVEPESARSPTFQMKFMAPPETAGKTPMFKRMIEVQPAVVAWYIVPDPFIVPGVYVRSLGMTRHIRPEMSLGFWAGSLDPWSGWPRLPHRRRATFRNVTAAHTRRWSTASFLGSG
jgi:hypothetical protein